MKNAWQMIATFVLVAALAVSGHAGPGNGNGGDKSKGKPDKEQKQKPEKEKKQKPDNSDKQAEKEARKAEKDARKAEKQAERAAKKALKQAEKLAKKAAKDAGASSFSIGQIIVTDSRIIDLTGDYLLEAVISLDGGTTASTSASLALVQDSRGQLVGNSLVTMPDGRVVEIPVVGQIEAEGDLLTLHLEGALLDNSASILIDGTWNGVGFDSDVTVTDLELVYVYGAEIIPVNALVGFIIEAPLSEQVIGNKVWSDRTVVLPWGNEVVRSQLMNKKGFKFMMHSGNFGIDLRGTADDAGVVTLSRAKLHLGYGDIWLDPATVEFIPVVE